jgi:lipopolysaccharide transport system ATP-binding protein
MSSTAIAAEGLGKRYRIGVRRRPYRTFREALSTGPAAAFRRLLRPPRDEGDTTVWALQDVSFAVRPGEAVGIVGRNGAGKSTLLRILSRITEPTTGRVLIHGRVASLLEVGTGFHPELTGRENVFLNGAILGMNRREVQRKFDDIVAFAEVERFVDTPLKHYSSGMYLRLAFSVAAHLEAEILIVDEVLAVGDLGFQVKCLERMGSVSREGRTVLFVSHNLQAIQRLTARSLLIDQGRCLSDGATAEVLRQYAERLGLGPHGPGRYDAPLGVPRNHVRWAAVGTSEGSGLHRWGQEIRFDFGLTIARPHDGLGFSFQVMNELQVPICHFWLVDPELPFAQRSGAFRLSCVVPRLRLYMGSYTLTTWLAERRGGEVHETLMAICPFRVTMEGVDRPQYEWAPGACAYVEEASWAPVVADEA